MYLGSAKAAADVELLTKLRISHILMVGEELVVQQQSVPVLYARLAVADEDSEDLFSHFWRCAAFIDRGRGAPHTKTHDLISPKAWNIKIV